MTPGALLDVVLQTVTDPSLEISLEVRRKNVGTGTPETYVFKLRRFYTRDVQTFTFAFHADAIMDHRDPAFAVQAEARAAWERMR